MINIDLIGKEGVQGELANYLMTQGKVDPGSLRPFIGKDGKAYISVYKGSGDPKLEVNYASIQTNNATLRRDEWKALDDAVLKISEKRLGGVQDLVEAGLVYNLNGMGQTVFEYHDQSDALSAELTMDGVPRAQNDRPVYTTNYLPLPIIHCDYEINSRVLAASRNMGNPLDTSLAERATRKVLETLESMLFTNRTYAFGGGTIYSYINHPDVNTVAHIAGLGWTNSSTVGGDIIEDVLRMKQAAIDAYHYGPYVLYIPSGYETIMDQDYSASKGDDTIRERILMIGGITKVKVIDTLPADTVLLVQMTSDTVRLVRGLGIQNVEWKTEGNFVNKFKVMTIQVPQIRSDQNGKCGIVKLA